MEHLIPQRQAPPPDPRVSCRVCRARLLTFGGELYRVFGLLEVRPPELGHDIWLIETGPMPLCKVRTADEREQPA